MGDKQMSRLFEVRWPGDLTVDDTWEDEYSDEVSWTIPQPKSKWEDSPDCFEKGSMKSSLGGPLFEGLPYEMVHFDQGITALDFMPTVAELVDRLVKLQADPTSIIETLGVDQPEKVAKALGHISDFVGYYEKKAAAGKNPYIRLW